MSLFMNRQKLRFRIKYSGNLKFGLTGLGIEVLDNVVDWHAHNPRTFWNGGIHLHPGSDWRWNAERGKFIINELRPL